MATQKLGVIVIHGVGSQAGERPEDPNVATYSKAMLARVRQKLGHRADDIVWREVCWADIMQRRQSDYLDLIRDKTRVDAARAFVLSALSDAAAYRKTSDGSAVTYEHVHSRIELTVRDLEKEIGPKGPVLILAHSLGGHIMSNYIYDLQQFSRATGDGRFASPLQNMCTVAGLMTFGCNIPVFLFPHRRNDVVPIDFPGVDLPASQQFTTWWQNFYDKEDILAYPMGPAAPRYAAMVAERQLRDVPVHLGGPPPRGWDPVSHGSYWDDTELIVPVVHYINKLFDA